MNTHTYIARPTGKRINPTTPEAAYFYDHGQTHYILEMDGKARDFTSFGTFPLAIGDRIEMKHDEGRWLGMAKVTGIRHPDATTEGVIPNKNMPHWVAK